MKVSYSINETVHDNRRRGIYVPITVGIAKFGTPEYQPKRPSDIFNIVEPLRPFETIYLVSYTQGDGDSLDEEARYFTSEAEAKHYLIGLARAISLKEGVEEVETHYNGGVKNLVNILENMPVNTYVSFRTPKTFVITFAKASESQGLSQGSGSEWRRRRTALQRIKLPTVATHPRIRDLPNLSDFTEL